MGNSITITSDDLLSVTQAAERLGRPKPTLYRWIDKNIINSVRLGGTIFIAASEVERLQKEGLPK